MMKPKYEPEMDTILREIDPHRAKRDQDNAMASLQRPTPPMFFPKAGGDAAKESAQPRASAPSPWAKDGAGADVDKAALPSAMTPGAGAEERPVTKQAAAGTEKASKLPWKVIAGLAAFVVAVALVSVIALVGQMRDAARRAAAAASATVTATVTSAAAAPSTEPSLAVVPSATTMPSVTAVPSVTASLAPSTPPRKPPIKPRERHGEPPGEPVPTTAPVEPPPPKYFE